MKVNLYLKGSDSGIKKIKKKFHITLSIIKVMSFSGFDANTRLVDEEEDCPTLLEHDFNRFHHTIPGLRRSGVDANAIRQVRNEMKMKRIVIIDRGK